MEIGALENIAKTVVASLRNTLVSKGIDATGRLSESIIYQVSPKFISIEMLQYGEFVDSGTKPHWAPIKPIKTWVQAKGLSLNPYAVRANIAKYGTKPHPWLYKFKETILELDEELLNYMGIIIEKDLDDKFTKIWN